MELQFLKAHSPMDWVSIDLILISLLITIITINVFILTRRLHHLEKHKMLDLEADYHDDHFLNKFRSLQTLNAEKGPFDEVAFRAFMNLNAGKDCTLITGTAEKRSTLDREALLQALVDFFKRYGSETPVTKNEGDTVTSPPEYSATGICDTNQGIASGTTGEASDVDSCDAQSEVSSVSEDWPETNQESSPKLSCSGCSKDPCVIAKECQNVVGWGCRICAKMWCTSCWDKIYAAAAALNPSMRLHSITCGCGGSVESYGSTFMLPHRQVLLQDAIKKICSENPDHLLSVSVDCGTGRFVYVISQLELTAGQIRNSQVWEGGEETSSIPEANSIAAHKGSLTSLANSAQNSSRATYPNTSFGFSLPSTTGLGGDPTHPYAYDMGGIPSLDNPGATTPIYQGYNPTPTALPRPSTFLFDDANNDTPPPTVQAAKSSEWSTGVEDDSLPPPEYSDSASSFGHESANAYSPGW